MEIADTLILCELFATVYLLRAARGRVCSKGPAALFALILLALMYPAWKAYGGTGLIVSQVLILTVIGFLSGKDRYVSPSSPRDAWKPSGEDISSLLVVHLFQSLVGGSLIHHEGNLHRDASWGTVFLTASAIGIPLWYCAGSLVALLGSRNRKGS